MKVKKMIKKLLQILKKIKFNIVYTILSCFGFILFIIIFIASFFDMKASGEFIKDLCGRNTFKISLFSKNES